MGQGRSEVRLNFSLARMDHGFQEIPAGVGC